MHDVTTEQLEPPLLLSGAIPDHVFAQFDGNVTEPDDIARISLLAPNAGLTLGSGRTLLGLL